MYCGTGIDIVDLFTRAMYDVSYLWFSARAPVQGSGTPGAKLARALADARRARAHTAFFKKSKVPLTVCFKI